MRHVTLPRIGTLEAWRSEARQLAEAGIAPEDVTWSRGEAALTLFSAETPPLPAQRRPITVPKSYVGLCRSVAAHSDPERFALLYQTLIRLQTRPGLLQDRADRIVHRLRQMEKAVHRDQHKMKAFLRFRETTRPGTDRRAFVAWFEPTHFIMENMADFFRNRFAAMDFLIVTPDMSMRFEEGRTEFALDTPRPPSIEDGAEDLWKTYFANIFNPARLKISAMTSEMPKKYWKNLPEAQLIPGMIASAQARQADMQQRAPSQPNSKTESWRMTPQTLDDARQRAAECTRCPLHAPATGTVFGEGPDDAGLMVVGEQPGDAEDLAGRPFVGPAGQVFDRVSREVGLDRDKIYVTNAVKHFGFNLRGKRRIHQRPNTSAIQHCRWWLDQEIALVKPDLVLAMGASAAEALTGSGSKILSRRGTIEPSLAGPPVLITLHPSFILRTADSAARDRALADFRSDLAMAKSILADGQHGLQLGADIV